MLPEAKDLAGYRLLGETWVTKATLGDEHREEWRLSGQTESRERTYAASVANADGPSLITFQVSLFETPESAKAAQESVSRALQETGTIIRQEEVRLGDEESAILIELKNAAARNLVSTVSFVRGNVVIVTLTIGKSEYYSQEAANHAQFVLNKLTGK